MKKILRKRKDLKVEGKVWFKEVKFKICGLEKKFESLKENLKQQININSSMKQWNQMLELKLQKLEAEKMKLSVENQYLHEKFQTQNHEKFKEAKNTMKLKLLRFYMKNHSKKAEKRRKFRLFNWWKTMMFQAKILEIKIQCGK